MIGDMPDLLAARAALSPEAVALRADEQCLTYGQLDLAAGRAAALLAAHGVVAGDRVAILCRNRPDFFVLLFACARAGAILVPLNWRMPPTELAGLIAHAEPALLIHGPEDAAAADLLGVPKLALDENYHSSLRRHEPVRGRQAWGAGDTWYLLYTSGTTGTPKAVVYTFGMALANAINIGSATGLRAGDRTLCALPLFHTAGINLHALPTLFAGGEVTVLPGFDADAVVSLIEARKLDLLFGVPTVYQALLSHPRFAHAPLGHVRHWGSGGAPLPDRLVESYRDLGVRLCNGMGMTETGPTAFLLSPEDAWDHIGSVGKPQLLCRARIVDEAGDDVAAGAVGDLLFAGPGVTPGYWRNEEATRAAFTEDGWLRSGDLARRDAAGFYYIAGRRKEMFISGGENVYPIEVENVLAAHPAVLDAAVLPAADPKWGEVGRAFVQLAPGHPVGDPADLQAFCRQRLAPYKVPVQIKIVREFPRTSAGKIQKHLLA